MHRPQSSTVRRSRPSSGIPSRTSTPTLRLPDTSASVKVSESVATVASAFINSPASPDDISERLERITRLHRRWQGWTPVSRIRDPSNAAASTTGPDVDDIRLKRPMPDATAGAPLPSYLERLKEVARGVAEDGGAVWSITEQLTQVLQHYSAGMGKSTISTAEASAMVTSCLEALTMLFAPDAILGSTFRQLFEIVKRTAFVDHAQLLAESDIPPEVRSFVRYTTDPSTRTDLMQEARTEAELRAYVTSATSVDWGTWVKHRAADVWSAASPHAELRGMVSDNAVALGRDVATLDQKIALHRAGKPILRRGGAQGFAFAVATGERTAADAHKHDVEQHVGSGNTPTKTSPTVADPEGSVTAARDSLTLKHFRQAVAFRGWRGIIHRQKVLNRVAKRWTGHVAAQVLGDCFRAWRLDTCMAKCARRSEDLRASETSFSAERLSRLDTLVQLKSAERQTESLWITVENLRSENRSYLSRLNDLSSPMVFDFRRPMYDAITGQEWVEGTLRFRKHVSADDTSAHGYADLFFDLEHRATIPSSVSAEPSEKSLQPSPKPKSHYVVRLEDTKPAGVAKPAVDPTLHVLNDIVAAMARTAHRDLRRKAGGTASSSGTSSPKSRSGALRAGSPTNNRKRNATPQPDPPKKLTLMETLSVEYHSHQEARINKFDECWAALCEVRAVAAATTRSSALGKPLTTEEIRRILREESIHATSTKTSTSTIASVEKGSPATEALDPSKMNSGALRTAIPPVVDYATSKLAADPTVPPKRFVIDAFAFEPHPAYHLKDMNAVTDRPELLAAVAASLTTPAVLARGGAAAAAAMMANGHAGRLPASGYNSSSGSDSEGDKDSEHAFESSMEQSPPFLNSGTRTNPLHASPAHLGTKKSMVIVPKTPHNTRVALRALRRLGLLGRVEDAVFNPLDPSVPTHVRRSALQLVCARLHSYALMKPNFEEATQSRSTVSMPKAPSLARTEGATGSGILASSTPLASMSFSAMMPTVSFQNVAPNLQPTQALTTGHPSGVLQKAHPLLVELADQRVGRLRSDTRILAPVLEWTRQVLAEHRGGGYVDVESWLWGERDALPPRNFGEDFGDGLSMLVAFVAALAPVPFAEANSAWIATTEGVEHDVVDWLIKAATDLGAPSVNIPCIRVALLNDDADGKVLYLTALYFATQIREVLPSSSPGTAWSLPASVVVNGSAANSALTHEPTVNLGNSNTAAAATAVAAKPTPLSLLNGIVPAKPPTTLLAKLAPFIAPAKKSQAAKGKADGLEPVFKVVGTAWISFLRAQCLRYALMDTDVVPAELHGASARRLPSTDPWDGADDGETLLGLSHESSTQWLAPAVRLVIRACSNQQQIVNASAMSASTALSASATAPVANTAAEIFSLYGLAPLLSNAAVEAATDAAVDLQVLRAWLQSTRMTPDDARQDASNFSVSTSAAGRVVGWWKSIPKEHQSNAGRYATARKGPLTSMLALPISSGIEIVMRMVSCLHSFFAQHWPAGNAAGGIKPPLVVACAEALCYALHHLHPSIPARLADTNALRWSILLPEDCLATLRTAREPLAVVFVAHSVCEVKTWATLEARAMSRGNAIKCFLRWWTLCWSCDAVASNATTSSASTTRTSVGLCGSPPPSNANVLIGRCFDVVYNMRCDKALRDGGVPLVPFGKASKSKAARSRAQGTASLSVSPESFASPEESFEAVVAGKHTVPVPATVINEVTEEASKPGVVPPGTLAEYFEDHDSVTFSGFCEVLAGVARLVYPVPWMRTADAVSLMVDVAKRHELA